MADNNKFLNFIDSNKINIIIALCIIAILFIIVGHIYREQIQLVLKKEFVRFPSSSLDWWSVSHFVLFGIFGFLMPNYPLSFFTIGSIFELLEDYLSSDDSTQLCDCKTVVKNKVWCNGIQDDYWYMNPTDPWVNLTGYIVGSAVRSTYF